MMDVFNLASFIRGAMDQLKHREYVKQRFGIRYPGSHDPIWVLPTRGRPEQFKASVEAVRDAGMTTRCVVIDDEESPSDPGMELELPGNFAYVRARADLTTALEAVYQAFPNAKCYGVLADDLRPQTPSFDWALEDVAGHWLLADCEGGYVSRIAPHEALPVALDGAFCWGGQLVRAVGRLTLPPGIRQGGNDDAWTHLTQKVIETQVRTEDINGHRVLVRGLRAKAVDVRVDHHNWRTGKRPKDDTDEWVRDGVPYIEHDFAELNRWKQSGAPEELARQLEAVPAVADWLRGHT